MSGCNPLVSFIIPVYNQAPFLSDTLNSVLNQTYSNLEIILIDDGSTDDSQKIGRKYETMDSRIHYVWQANRGPSAARNRGIQESKGAFIFLLDGDDLIDPKLIESDLAEFRTHPEIDIIYTAFHIIDDQGQIIGEVHNQQYVPEDLLALLFFRNLIGPGAIMARRHCLVDHPYQEDLKHAEDYELLLRLAHHYRFHYLDQPLRSYRRHQANVSNDLAAHHQATIEVINQYSSIHIQEVVARSTFSIEQKTLLLGKIYYTHDRLQEALPYLQALHSPLSYFYLGNCYLKLKELDKAKKNFLKALELDPSNPACHNNLGVVFASLEEFQQAKNCFRKALALKADYLDAQFNLANLNRDQAFKMTERELRSTLIPYQQIVKQRYIVDPD